VKGSELLRVIGAQVCLHATMAGMRLATPLLALQQGYSAAAVGVLISLFALTQVFLALPAGRFADRYGFKRPLWLSVIAAVTGAGLVVIFPIFPVMCLAALLTGGATGATVIASASFRGIGASLTAILLSSRNGASTVGVGALIEGIGHENSPCNFFACNSTSMPAINCAHLS
jgi:MFS family permease